MRFLQPDAAIWLLPIPLVVSAWFLFYHLKRRFRSRASFGSHLDPVSKLSGWRRDVTSLVAGTLALGLLAASITRPQVLLETRTPEYEKEDLVLVFDRSVSMRATDIQPSRFSRAVAEIKAFLARKPDAVDRIALVAFSGTSIMLSPFSRDVDKLMFYLDWIEQDPELRLGTNIGSALSTARELVRKDNRPTRKLFLIVSDGDDQSAELTQVVAALREDAIPVYTVGIGSNESAFIPLTGPDGRPGYLTDESGRRVTTHFNDETLRNIALQTGGRFIRSITGSELTPAMHEAIQRERRVVAYSTTVQYRDLYRECLAAAGLAIFVLLLAL